jgi:hypothetical protein
MKTRPKQLLGSLPIDSVLPALAYLASTLVTKEKID